MRRRSYIRIDDLASELREAQHKFLDLPGAKEARRASANRLRQKVLGRAQCDRCGGSGIHGSSNLKPRVCGLCLGQGWLEKPPIPKIQPSKGFGKLRAGQKKAIENL